VNLTAVVLIGSVLGCSACSYGLRPPKVEAGRGFSAGRDDNVKRGDHAAEVRTLLGEPYEIERNGDIERWRYYMRVFRSEERRLFGFIPFPDSTSRGEFEAVVIFRDGVVDSVSSTRKRLK
jgi:hypothetical protein